MCYRSLIPLCSFHEMDEVKDSERERLNRKEAEMAAAEEGDG